jgi:hypothetical protein
MEEGGDRQPVELIPENRRLQDLQHYLETRGLRPDEEGYGASSELNLSETRKRLREEKEYQESVIKHAFSEEKDDDHKIRLLKSLEETMIRLKTLDGEHVEARVRPLAESCDTIYALASTRELFKESSPSSSILELSLEIYPRESVSDFVHLASGIAPLDSLSADNVVDICQIAHYLQCGIILEPVVEILTNSVDTTNCRSLLELADRLHFPVLFERCLSKMMESLEETEDVWDELTPELRDRILLMKEAMESSILAGKSRLYFGSLEEYLAMFQEMVQYNRERLFDARQRQAEIREAFFSRSRGWEYNQRAIERQEARVNRLEYLLQKQKSMFSGPHKVAAVGPADQKRAPAKRTSSNDSSDSVSE